MMLTELDPVVKRGLVTGVSLVLRRYEDHDSDSRENFSRGVGKLLQLSNNKRRCGSIEAWRGSAEAQKHQGVVVSWRGRIQAL